MNSIELNCTRTIDGITWHYRLLCDNSPNIRMESWCWEGKIFRHKFRYVEELWFVFIYGPNFTVDDGKCLTEYISDALYDFTKLYSVASDTDSSIMEQL
jgi:hypothetical protein